MTCTFFSLAQQAKKAPGCTQNLNEAEDAYDEGRLQDVILMLENSDCFVHNDKDEYSKEERVRAYRLMTLAYLFTDNEIKAEEAFVNLLHVSPEHVVNPNVDPAEFVYLDKKFRSDPIFRVGFKFGANISSIHSMATYATFDTDSLSKTYKSGTGFQLEGTFEYALPYNFEAVVGLGYYAQAYSVSSHIVSPFYDEDGEPDKPILSTFQEKQNWLKVPLMVRYNLPLTADKRWVGYVYGGASLDFLLQANVEATLTANTIRTTASELKSLGMRNASNFSYFGGLGIKLKTKTNYWFADFRYGVGAKNFVNVQNRYNDSNLLFDAAHVDDDMRINNVSFSLGYIHSIYNPKKLSDKKFRKLMKK